MIYPTVVCQVPGRPQHPVAAVGLWDGSFWLCSSAPSLPVQMWSAAAGFQSPPASAPQTPSSQKHVNGYRKMLSAVLKILQNHKLFFLPLKTTWLAGWQQNTGLHFSHAKCPHIWGVPSALKPSTEDKKLRSIHLATSQIKKKKTHVAVSRGHRLTRTFHHIC